MTNLCVTAVTVEREIVSGEIPTSFPGSLFFPPNVIELFNRVWRKEERPWERGWRDSFVLYNKNGRGCRFGFVRTLPTLESASFFCCISRFCRMDLFLLKDEFLRELNLRRIECLCFAIRFLNLLISA